MTEPSDEDWAAGLRAYARGTEPDVPVDIAGAVRRGRRRRAARSVVLGGGSLAVVVGVVAVVGPSLLGGLGSTDSAGDSAASMADTGADSVAGAATAEVWSVESLARAVADPAQGQSLTLEDSASTEQLTVEQHGRPDAASATSIEAAIRRAPAAVASSARPSAGPWPAGTVACLDGAGWEVTATDDGWTAQVSTSSAVRFLVDVAACTPAAG